MRVRQILIYRCVPNSEFTAGIISPQMLRLFQQAPPSLRRVITGSERFSDICSEHYDIINVCGMSEVSHISLFLIDRPYGNTPVGKALDGVELRICDQNGQKVSQGEEGEIWICGEFDVSYFRDPELTERKMLALPDGRTAVRSGDIGYEDEQKVLQHYAIYGTVFCFNDEGEWVPRYRKDLIEPLRLIYTTQRDYMTNLRQQMLIPYRIFDALHYRMQVCVTEEACYLMMDFNHTIADGTSIMNTLHSIFDVLAGKPLPQDRYYLYLQKQGQARLDPQTKDEAEKLLRLYDDASYSRFPAFDFEGRDDINYTAPQLGPRPYSAYLKAAAQKKVSFGTVLVAAGLKALSVYNGTPKVEAEWVYHGRDEAWKSDLVGLTISAVPTAIDFDEIKSVDELFAEVRRQAAVGIRYAPFSFAVSNVSPSVNDYMKIVNEEGIDLPENLPAGTEQEQPYELKNATLCTYQTVVFPPEDPDTPICLLTNCNIAHYRKESIKRYADLVFDALDEFLFSALD